MRLTTTTLFLLSVGLTSVVAVPTPTPMPEPDLDAPVLQAVSRDVDTLHSLSRRMIQGGSTGPSQQGQSSGGSRGGRQGGQHVPIQYIGAATRIPVTDGSSGMSRSGGQGSNQVPVRHTSGATPIPVTGGSRMAAVPGGTSNSQSMQRQNPSSQNFGNRNGGPRRGGALISNEDLLRGDMKLPPPPSTHAPQRAASHTPAQAPFPAQAAVPAQAPIPARDATSAPRRQGYFDPVRDAEGRRNVTPVGFNSHVTYGQDGAPRQGFPTSDERTKIVGKLW